MNPMARFRDLACEKSRAAEKNRGPAPPRPPAQAEFSPIFRGIFSMSQILGAAIFFRDIRICFAHTRGLGLSFGEGLK